MRIEETFYVISGHELKKLVEHMCSLEKTAKVQAWSLVDAVEYLVGKNRISKLDWSVEVNETSENS